MRYLVIHDADAIQGYVFATGRLREIRGASALIDRLNREDSCNLIREEQFIYVGGGGVGADFADETEAQFFCQSVSALYATQTFSASSTGVVETYDETVPNDNPNSFCSALQRAHSRLRQEKVSRRRKTQLLTSPLFKRCQACGIYPVVYYDANMPEAEGEENRFVCRSCYNKRRVAYEATTEGSEAENQRTRQWSEATSRESGFEAERSEQRESYIHQEIQLEAQRQQLNIRFPTQIDEIGAGAVPKGYIGIIYADGNRMGDKLQCIQTKTALAEFSQTIEYAIRNAIIESLLRRCDVNLPLRVIVPICGGDDLVAIVPGHHAFELAIDYLDCFQDYVRRHMPNDVARMLNSREVSACAGVAIAKSHTPLSELFDLSHELCKLAKRRSYKLFHENSEGEEREVPCVDFQVVTTPSWRDIEETRRTEYLMDNRIRLTSRPYTVCEARGLIRAARALRQQNFPRGKLYDFYRSLRRGQHQAVFDYLMLYVRSRETESIRQQSALSEVEDYLEIEQGRAPWKDWANRPRGLQTPYGDLVEIYEFISPHRVGC